jgi:hypothetical protein
MMFWWQKFLQELKAPHTKLVSKRGDMCDDKKISSKKNDVGCLGNVHGVDVAAVFDRCVSEMFYQMMAGQSTTEENTVKTVFLSPSVTLHQIRTLKVVGLLNIFNKNC